jgi:hypothetical protein
MLKIKIKESGEIYNVDDVFVLTQNGEEFSSCMVPVTERDLTFDYEEGMYIICKERFDWFNQNYSLGDFLPKACRRPFDPPLFRNDP